MTRETARFGCTAALLLPFCGVGAFMAAGAARAGLAGDWGEAGNYLLFALVFGGVGFGTLGFMVHRLLRRRELERLAADRPNEPWLRRRDWAAGRIEGSSRRTMLFAWAFAALWNLLSAPLPFVIAREVLEKGNRLALLGALFPAIGVGLLVWAIRATMRYRKFGTSVFRMAHVPGVIGRNLAGVILANGYLRPDDGFHLTLTCINRITRRTGKETTTHETVLWQDERTVTETGRVGARATAIPVSFKLPPDVRESDDGDPANRIIWRLEARASVPGVDYHASFEVPIFRTPESSIPPSPEDEESLAAAIEVYRQSPDSRIRVTRTLHRTEIFFSAARNLGVAIGVTLFFALWTAVTWALPRLGAPIIFPIAFGFFDVLIALMLVSLWLGTTRVAIGPSGAQITYGLLGIGWTRAIPAGEIDDITLKIGMQSGTRPYYDIKIVRADGKKLPAGGSIRDKREAEWLVAQMTDAAGL